MHLEQKHLSVTVAQDNLELRVRRVRREQPAQEELTVVPVVEQAHAMVLVHLILVHVTLLLR
jgi:hypothetical protein